MVGILAFTRSFASAVLVQLGMFTHSKLRRGISGACGLVRTSSSQAAVGESNCRSTLFVLDKLDVNHRVYLPKGDSRHTVPIEMIALDDHFKPGARMDVIKMDIQEYELQALRRASRVLVDKPGISCSSNFGPYGLKQAGANWVQLIGVLKENGKLVQQLSSEGLTGVDPGSANESEARLHRPVRVVRIVSGRKCYEHYAGLELATERFLYRRRIKNPRTNTTVVRFKIVKTLNSVGSYLNSTSFFPAGSSAPTCHWFTRSAG